MYVQLLVRKQIDGPDGRPRNYQPGDFVDVGKQTARQWIAQGAARVLDYGRAGLLPAASGVQPWGTLNENQPVMEGLGFGAYSQEPQLTFFRTLLWRDNAPLRLGTIAAGFQLLDTWQVAIPLMDYNVLANQVGTEHDRQLTENVIHDLRVPLYDIRLIFARRCSDTEHLLTTWAREIVAGNGELYLSFLRALYTAKPLILPLPITWGNADGSDGYV